MMRFAVRILSIFILLILVGCKVELGLADAVKEIVPKIDKVIDAVDRNSVDWQNQLQQLVKDAHDLESRVKTDVQNTVRLATNGIDSTLQNATGAAAAEAQCSADIVRLKVSQSLKYYKAELQRAAGINVPEVSPAVPYICNSTPNSLHMDPDLRESAVVFWGYDLANPDIKVSLAYGSNLQVDFPASLLATVSNYKLTLNTSAGDNPLLCSKNNRKIMLKWKTQTISEMTVNTASCKNPEAPPSLPEHVLETKPVQFMQMINPPAPPIDTTTPAIIGRACTPNYVQSRFEITVLAGTWPNATCKASWISSDTKNCQLRVSPVLPPPSITLIQAICQVTIYETGAPQPPPEPCACW